MDTTTRPTIDIDELRADIAGREFPGSEFAIEGWANWLMCDISAAAPTDSVHPVFGFLGPLGAMGLSIDDIFDLCRFDAADGPMLASTAVEFAEPLALGDTYTVTGRILDIVRKQGRRAGVFDLMTFRLEVCNAAGTLVVTTTNVFMLPRKDLQS